MKKNIAILGILLIIIAFILFAFYLKKENNHEKINSNYVIEVKEQIDNKLYLINIINNKRYFTYNLSEINYITKTKNIPLLNAIKNGYMNENILKLQMKKIDINKEGEFYKYDGTGSIGTNKFSMYIYNDSIAFSTYDYDPENAHN